MTDQEDILLILPLSYQDTSIELLGGVCFFSPVCRRVADNPTLVQKALSINLGKNKELLVGSRSFELHYDLLLFGGFYLLHFGFDFPKVF